MLSSNKSRFLWKFFFYVSNGFFCVKKRAFCSAAGYTFSRIASIIHSKSLIRGWKLVLLSHPHHLSSQKRHSSRGSCLKILPEVFTFLFRIQVTYFGLGKGNLNQPLFAKLLTASVKRLIMNNFSTEFVFVWFGINSH